MRVLNVGGGGKHIKLPAFYEGWEHVMLDIDPASEPDIVADARELRFKSRLAGTFDAVLCSHNLEHFYRHEVAKVLEGFRFMLAPGGFVHIQVPNIGYVIRHLAATGGDLEDIAYVSSAGPIKYIDMIFGLGRYIAERDTDWMCHKNAFTARSLGTLLCDNGFPHVFIGEESTELMGFAFIHKPTLAQMKLLRLRYPDSGGTGDNSGLFVR